MSEPLKAMKDGDKQLLIRVPFDVYESLRAFSFFGKKPMREIVLQALDDWKLHEKARKLRDQSGQRHA